MPEQSFADAVRESRVFYRRELAKAIAVAQIRTTSGVDPHTVAARATEIVSALAVVEDLELAKDRT